MGGPPSALYPRRFSRARENVLHGHAHNRASTLSRCFQISLCSADARSAPNSMSYAVTCHPHQARAKLTGARRPEQKSTKTGSDLGWKSAPARELGAEGCGPGSSGASSLSDRDEARHPQRLPPPPLLPLPLPRAPRRLALSLLPFPLPFLRLRAIASCSFSECRALQ
jgi:hypothetical protein